MLSTHIKKENNHDFPIREIIRRFRLKLTKNQKKKIGLFYPVTYLRGRLGLFNSHRTQNIQSKSF